MLPSEFWCCGNGAAVSQYLVLEDHMVFTESWWVLMCPDVFVSPAAADQTRSLSWISFFDNFSVYCLCVPPCVPPQSTPPEYHVQDMKVPTALFSGGQDTLADPKDVAVLLTQVSRVYSSFSPAAGDQTRSEAADWFMRLSFKSFQRKSLRCNLGLL